MNHIKTFLPAVFAVACISCTTAGNEMNAQNYYQQDQPHNHQLHNQEWVAAPQTSQVSQQEVAGNGEVVLRDPQLNNMPAMRIKIPASYQLQGGIIWEQTQYDVIPVCRVQILSSTKSACLTTYPLQAQIAHRGPTANMMAQNAQMLGMSPEAYVGRVLPEEQSMRALLLPEVEKKRGQIRIISEESIPNLDSRLWPGQNKDNLSYRGRKLTIAYQQNGVEMKEELYGLYYRATQQQDQDEITVWGLNRTFGISAPAQTFDHVRNELLGIASSFTNKPEYEKAVQQVMERNRRQRAEYNRQQMIMSNHNHQQRMAANKASFEASQEAYRSTQAAYDQQNASWSQNQDALYRSNQNVNDNIVGYQRYNDPNTGQEYLLDNQNSHQWSNGSGTTIGTDDAYFDPNRYTTGEQYYQLQPKR